MRTSHLLAYAKDGDDLPVKVYIPCYLISYYQSRDFDLSELEAVKLAFRHQTGLPLEQCYGYEANGPVYDALGQRLEKGEFEVEEHFSGFNLVHVPTGRDHWLSDGVDVMSIGPLEHATLLHLSGSWTPSQSEPPECPEQTLHPGTLGFVHAWTDAMCNDSEALEAYFPDLVER